MTIPEWFAALTRQGAFKIGAGTASSPLLPNNLPLFREEPSPPLLPYFLERARVTRVTRRLEKFALARRAF